MSKIKLNAKQQEALRKMTRGENLFLTGMAGSGKSEVIRTFYQMYKDSRVMAVTSMTGASAILLNGTTLHSYLGIGLGTNSTESLITTIKKKRYLKERWIKLQTLIIDEVSLKSVELFNKLNMVAKSVRNRFFLPFGGIQLILSGDFLQLPVIGDDHFCFESEAWQECIGDNIIELTENMRQGDPLFQQVLSQIRIGNVEEGDVKEILNKRIGMELKNDLGIKPTKLYSHNIDVDEINRKELNKLIEETGIEYEYNLEFTIYPNKFENIMEKYAKYCRVPTILKLTLGAQVMLLYNMDIENKLVNGSRGVVINFLDDLPVVRFLNGDERIIDYHIWEIEENDKKIASYSQVPLTLGYAYSIHKTMGVTLDYVEVDLGKIFTYGMAYVALSRVRTLEGLSIKEIDYNKIKAHPVAKEFYLKLRQKPISESKEETGGETEK